MDALRSKESRGNLFFSQFGEDAYLQRYYASKAWQRYGDATQLDSGFYVDVGAHAPKEFSNTYWFYKQGLARHHGRADPERGG